MDKTKLIAEFDPTTNTYHLYDTYMWEGDLMKQNCIHSFETIDQMNTWLDNMKDVYELIGTPKCIKFCTNTSYTGDPKCELCRFFNDATKKCDPSLFD